MTLSDAEICDLAEAVRISRDGSAKALRLALGIAAAAIGMPCGVTPSAISRWENGLRRPRGEAAVAWVRLLRRLEDQEGPSSVMNNTADAADNAMPVNMFGSK
jgi:transcriptional regulator with XRE-family HTH domain